MDARFSNSRRALLARFALLVGLGLACGTARESRPHEDDLAISPQASAPATAPASLPIATPAESNPDRLLAAGSLSPPAGADRVPWHAWVLSIRNSAPPAPKATSDNQPAPLRNDSRRAEAALFHLQPDLEIAPRSDSSLRLVNWFVLPDGRARIAAYNELLYLAIPTGQAESVLGFPPPPASPTRLYAFSTLLRDGRWYSAYSGIGQRVEGLPGGEELPSLPGDRELVSLAACETGVLALLRPLTEPVDQPDQQNHQTKTIPRTPFLQLLPRKGIAPAWIPLQGLATLPDLNIDSPVELVAGLTTTKASVAETPLAMLASGIDGEAGQLHLGSLRAERVDGPPSPIRLGGGAPVRYVVAWAPLNLPVDLPPSALRDARVAFSHAGLLLAARRVGASTPATWHLWMHSVHAGRSEAAWRELASVDAVSVPPHLVPPALAPMDGEDRILMLWPGAKTATIAPTDRLSSFLNIQSASVSTSTGRVMERGPMQGQPTLTIREYRLVGLLLAWVAGLIGLVLVRPKEAAILLPGDVSLAEPLRRLVAGLIDLTLAATLGAFLVNGRVEDIITISVFDVFFTTQGQSLLLATLLVGVATSTLGESLTGRTLGKWFVGSLVVRCASPGANANHALELSYPSAAQAFVRNAIKWCLLPAAFVAIWREGARHRGEQYTHTAVVVPMPPEDEEDFE